MLTSRPILSKKSHSIIERWPPNPSPPPLALPQISISPLWLINKKDRSLGGGASTGQRRKNRGHLNTLILYFGTQVPCTLSHSLNRPNKLQKNCYNQKETKPNKSWDFLQYPHKNTNPSLLLPKEKYPSTTCYKLPLTLIEHKKWSECSLTISRWHLTHDTVLQQAFVLESCWDVRVCEVSETFDPIYNCPDLKSS